MEDGCEVEGERADVANTHQVIPPPPATTTPARPARMVRREMWYGGGAAGRGDGEMAGTSVDVCSHGVNAIVWRGPGTGGRDMMPEVGAAADSIAISDVGTTGRSLPFSGDTGCAGEGLAGATSGAGCVVDAGFFGVARMVGAELRACSAS